MNVYSSKGYWRVPFSNIPDTDNTIREADIILGINTAPMMYNFMSGFPMKVLLLYALQEEDILEAQELIRNNAAWYEAVVKQAEQHHLTVEENLRINAIYYLENRKHRKQ